MARKDACIQALRGLAIAAVVLIHCLPESPASVALRPFLNWSVALFLFLSGALTTEERVLRGGVIRRRLSKVAAPYLVWSAIYLAANPPQSVLGAVRALVTGGASWQMYYLLVYAQLVAFTPLLFRLLRRFRLFLYAVTPCVLVVWEALAVLGVDAPSISFLFPAWLVYYLFGLEWHKWCDVLQRKRALLFMVTVFALALQVTAGFAWASHGDYGMATTQLKMTNMASSLCVCASLMLLPKEMKTRLSGSGAIVRLGDFSFGIYLVHMAFVLLALSALSMVGLIGIIPALCSWLAVLVLSAISVAVCRRVLPQRLLQALGFA